MLYFCGFTAVCGTGRCQVEGLAGYSSSHHMWDLGLSGLRGTSVTVKTNEKWTFKEQL